jgi:aminoglycoside phosphotransferase (APT) family kinase protein
MDDGAWSGLVDLTLLEGWMDERGLGDGAIKSPRLLTGGTQNILLQFERAGRSYVLRRSPSHPRGDGNATNRREARVLAALSGTPVPHPGLIAACSDADVLGAAFFLMEPVDGFNATVSMPRLHRESHEIRRRMGFALVEGALALGAVNTAATGLADFGKSEGFLVRQVPRWRSLLESYRDYAAWPGSEAIPGVSAVGNWLAANVPATFSPGLMHGDYHLANVMYRFDSGEVASIVDWELCTVGDPLLDMGWLMATWPSPDGTTTSAIIADPWSGFATIEELIDHYRQGSARQTDDLLWYGVLACYKLGLIVEGTYARACDGLAPPETGQRLHASCLLLFERALGWLDGGRTF